jgi:hypothetical protein
MQELERMSARERHEQPLPNTANSTVSPGR